MYLIKCLNNVLLIVKRCEIVKDEWFGLFCASVYNVYVVTVNSGKIRVSADNAGALETSSFLVWSSTNRICLMLSGNFDLALG